MLGAEHRLFLPKLYLDTRKNRFFFPRYLKKIGILLFFLFFGTLLYFLDALPLILVGVLLLIGMYRYFNFLLLRRMLVNCRGKVCPCCWRASDQPKQGCLGCHAPAGPTSHRQYWRILRLHGVAAEQWFTDLFRVQEKPPP